MELMIKSIHFDTTEKLQAFIEKKVAKLEKTYEDIQKVEVQLKVVKPATAMNKSVSITVDVAGKALFADRKSTRLNSSHANISYAVFCLKKKKTTINEKQLHSNIK